MRTIKIVILVILILNNVISSAQNNKSNSADIIIPDLLISAKRVNTKLESNMSSYTISSSIIKSAGNTIDALRTVPGIVVQSNSNILLYGSECIININGKKINISKEALVDYLNSMPASSISRVEIISSPNAKHDAQGAGGIINIITKRESAYGLTSITNSSYQQHSTPRSNINSSLFYNRAKTSIFSNYSYNNGKYLSTLKTVREPKIVDHNNGSIFYMKQRSNMSDKINGNWIQLGIERAPNYQLKYGFILQGNNTDKYSSANMRSEIIDLDNIDAINSITNTIITPSTTKIEQLRGSINTYLNYISKNGSSHNFYTDYTSFDHKERVQISNSPIKHNGEISIFETQYNFQLPIDLKHSIELGAKYTDSHIRYITKIDEFIKEDYKERVGALFFLYSAKLKNVNLEAGLRVEDSNREGTELFPSLNLSQKINNGKNSIYLTYGRRVNRPTYRDLSPFNYIWDKYTISLGNPNLKSEIINNLEFGLIYNNNIRVSAFTTISKNPILQTIDISDLNVATIYPKNYSNMLKSGVRLQANNIKVASFWQCSLFASIYNSRYSWKSKENKSKISVITPMLNINNSFEITHGIKGEVSGFYVGNMAFGQGVIKPHGSVSAAIAKSFMNNSLNIQITINDILQSNRQNLKLNLMNNSIKASTNQFNDHRSIGISITYRFKGGTEAAKNRGSMDKEYLKRVNL